MGEKFYRSSSKKCGMAIDSTYCKQITEGYICTQCGDVHPIKYWMLRAKHINGATIMKRFHSNNISRVVKLIGQKGWIPSELSQVKFSAPNIPAPMTRVVATR